MKSKERSRFKNNPIRMEAYMMMKSFRSRKQRSINSKTKEMDLDTTFVENLLRDFCNTNYHVWETKHPFRPSVDRIDNDKGYTKDNVKVVWLIENYCRNTFTEADVLEFCRRKLNLPEPL